MLYNFVGKSCPNAPAGTICDCHHEIKYPIGKAPPLDSLRKCPVKGCKAKVMRILSSGILCHVRGSVHDWKPGTAMRMNVGGQDVRMNFVDHPHTDPAYQRNLAELAGKNHIGGSAAGLGKARYSEKHGRMVVDIGSNVKDPLGVIERAKQQGTYQSAKIPVNTPVRMRARKGRK